MSTQSCDPVKDHTAAPPQKPRLEDIVAACGGIAILGIVCAGLQRSVPVLPSDPNEIDAVLGHHTSMVSYGLFFAVLVVVLLLHPLLAAAATIVRRHWRSVYTKLVIVAACAFVSVFIVHEGRHQFGGFDFGILIDVGWRQILGQHLYSDFIAPTPPGFSLGVKYAFQLFRVSWNANLYLAAFFAVATMLWLYWLMRRLHLSRLAAIGIAFAIEACSMLLLSFWWYNNTALVMASIYLLACLVYAQHQQERSAQTSYVSALAIFALMKPNVAGVAIAGSIPLLFVACTRRYRLALHILSALAIDLLILAANRISIAALLTSYGEASRNRGGLSSFGLDQMGPVDGPLAIFVTTAFAVSSLWVTGRVVEAIRKREYAQVALDLFLPVAFLTSLYAVRTNGDFWLVELPPLFAIGASINYASHSPNKAFSRFFSSLVCACVVTSLYLGAVRFRVFTIGPQQFFQWTDNQNLISEGFLKDMRVGAPMVEMEREIAAAVKTSSGPYFLGPRIDFNYAVLHLPSPDHLPAWWHPGVAFSPERIPALIKEWQEHRFQTLVFLRGDYTFYPHAFLDVIDRDYTRDDRYSLITVYHRRGAAQPSQPKPH